MKSLPLLVALLIATTGWAATPLDSRNPKQMLTVDNFFEACTVIGETAYGMIPHFDCETYLYGIVDTYQSLNPSLPAKQRLCLPENLAPWQLYEVLLTFDVEGRREDNAASYILKALIDTYPCT
jgi:hypothetical protein